MDSVYKSTGFVTSVFAKKGYVGSRGLGVDLFLFHSLIDINCCARLTVW